LIFFQLPREIRVFGALFLGLSLSAVFQTARSLVTSKMKQSYRLPPVQNLIAFEAVARLRSGALAAAELSVTPSAISHRIKQLEESLGETLLNRNLSELTLTSRGSEYLDVVRECLESLNRYPVRGNVVGQRPQLRIAAPPTFARQILVPRLPAFQTLYPDLEIVMQLSVPLVGLKADEADVEVRFGSGYYNGLNVELILDEPIFPVCSPAYLREKGPLRIPSDLSRADLLRCPLEPWRPWLAVAGLDWPEPSRGIQFIDLGLMVEAAINGQGVALARQMMSEAWLRTGALEPLFNLPAKGQYNYYCTWAASSVQSSAIESFVTWIKSALAE
jgi:LysR family glycine cleavage system transcriptional activator